MHDDIDKHRDRHVVQVFRLTPEQASFVKLHEDGTLDLPVSVIRMLTDWQRRFDLRPTAGRPR